MKKIVIGLICTVVCASALQYSHRIRALGTDFAYLIPDYETDLYRDVELFGKKLAGIAYTPHAHQPIKAILLTKRFGWYGKYWGDYSYEHNADYPFGWFTLREYSFSFEDLWMLDMRGHIWNFLGGVWHLYNDGYFRTSDYWSSGGYSSQTTELAYFIKSQGTHKIGKRLKLCDISGGAFYWQRNRESDIDHVNELLGMISGRVGLFYRNAPAENRFTSWFLDIGGPITTAEIDGLPYSLFSDTYHWFISGTETRLVWFANAFIGKAGWAKGIPIGDKSFLAIGLHNDFLYQNTEKPDTILTQRAVQNVFSFPLAVEYTINKIVLRFGTRALYHFDYLRESNNTTTFEETDQHALNYDYSFGLGWQPSDNLIVDLGYKGISTGFTIRDWSIYLKYLF